MARSVDQLVALLAVNLAGGTFLPLDPDAPVARLALILDDSQAICMITDPELAPRFADLQTPLLHVDANGRGLQNEPLVSALPALSDLAYVLFTVFMAVGQISLNGLGNQYLWPNWPAWGNVALPVGFALCGFFGAWFTRLFLHTRHSAPSYDRVLQALGGIFALLAAAPLVLPYQWVAVLVSLQGITFSLVSTGIALFGLKSGNRSARWFLLAWSLLLAGIVVMGARNLGWLPTNMLTTNAIQIGSALEMLLLSFALADRIHLARQEKEQAQVETLAAKEAMVTALRLSEQQLEQRVAERTRELAEANTRLRASEAQLTELAQHDPLTGLANRRRLTDALYQALNQAMDNRSEGAVLLVDLDRFKPVNDHYGHEIGDRLLQEVARRLQECVAPSDTVARLGGDEFVLLLPAPRSHAEVEHIAALVLACLLHFG